MERKNTELEDKKEKVVKRRKDYTRKERRNGGKDMAEHEVGSKEGTEIKVQSGSGGVGRRCN